MVEYQESGKIAYFNSFRFVRDDKTGYYLSSKCVGERRKRLHVAVWEFYKGQIPEGYQVHHKTIDKSRNNIEDLELEIAHKHLSLHAKMQNKEHVAVFHAKGIEAAKKWHKSEEGSEWHKKHYEGMKDKLFIKAESKCVVCGKTYLSPGREKDKFCSNACKSTWRRTQGLDNVSRVCVICGKTFEVNKYVKTRCCSVICGDKARIQARKDKKHKTGGQS